MRKVSQRCFRCGEMKDAECFNPEIKNKYTPSPWCWNCTNTPSGTIPKGKNSTQHWKD